MSVVNQPMPEKLATRWIETPIGAVEIGINLDSEIASLWYVEINKLFRIVNSSK